MLDLNSKQINWRSAALECANYMLRTTEMRIAEDWVLRDFSMSINEGGLSPSLAQVGPGKKTHAAKCYFGLVRLSAGSCYFRGVEGK